MLHETIINPKTGRINQVISWNIIPRQVVDKVKSGEYRTAKDLSWDLLSDRESTEKMEDEEYGDSASNNFCLGIFEHALDWTLGLKVFNYIMAALKIKKIPKPFKVAANRNGDVFIILASGRVF